MEKRQIIAMTPSFLEVVVNTTNLFSKSLMLRIKD